MDYDEFTMNLNKTMKQNNVTGTLSLLKDFCNVYIEEKTHAPSEWTMFGSDGKIPTGIVVVLAHSISPKRCLGILRHNKTIASSLPETLTYTFERLQVNKNEEAKGAKAIIRGKSKEFFLISQTRGHWVIWQQSVLIGIKEREMLLPANLKIIKIWNEKYIQGMEKPPAESFERTQFKGVEQFMMDNFPTPEWREHMLHYKKKNRLKRTLHEESETDESEIMLPEVPQITPFIKEKAPKQKTKKKRAKNKDDEPSDYPCLDVVVPYYDFEKEARKQNTDVAETFFVKPIFENGVYSFPEDSIEKIIETPNTEIIL